MAFSRQQLNLLSAEEKRLLLARLLKEKAQAPKTFPLSFAQQRLWFLDQLEPGNLAYVISLALQIQGHLQVAVVEKSLQEVVRRHESLRTVFGTENDQPLQVVFAERVIPLRVFDLCALPENVRLREAHSCAEGEAGIAFNLAVGPLLRVTLIRFDTQEHVLILSMHHIISDGWSVQLLVHELMTLYEAFSQERPSPLAPLKLQYGDFAAWQRSWLQGAVLEAHLDYWRNQLQGAMPLELSSNKLHLPARRRRLAAHYQFRLPADLTTALVKLGGRQDATLFMVLLAGFQILLYRYSGQTDIVVGTDIANRLNVETEAQIGFFVNILALRTRINGLTTFQNLLYQVRQMVLDAYTYQNLPFDLLVEHLRLERRAYQTPLIQVLLVLQNTPRTEARSSNLEVRSFVQENAVAKFDLALLLRQTSEGLRGTVTYCSDLLEHATIIMLMRRFEVLLQNIVQYPDRPLDTLEIHTAEEKRLKAEEKRERYKMRFSKIVDVEGQEIDSL